MAEVPYGPFMKTAPGKPPKRVFAANITNKDTTTSPPKRQKTAPEKKRGGPYVLKWTDKDRRNSKPHSDATKKGAVVVRTYGLPLTVQARHSPDIASDTRFYEHKPPNAAAAAKARQSGETVTFVPTSERPLEQPPINGGVSHTNNAFKISPDVVGVNEGLSAAAKKAHEVIARKKVTQSRPAVHGSANKGATFAPSFSVRFDGELVGKYKGRWQSALPDIKQKRPGEELSNSMLQGLLGIKKRELFKKFPGVKKKIDASKFTAEWD